MSLISYSESVVFINKFARWQWFNAEHNMLQQSKAGYLHKKTCDEFRNIRTSHINVLYY